VSSCLCSSICLGVLEAPVNDLPLAVLGIPGKAASLRPRCGKPGALTARPSVQSVGITIQAQLVQQLHMAGFCPCAISSRDRDQYMPRLRLAVSCSASRFTRPPQHPLGSTSWAMAGNQAIGSHFDHVLARRCVELIQSYREGASYAAASAASGVAWRGVYSHAAKPRRKNQPAPDHDQQPNW